MQIPKGLLLLGAIAFGAFILKDHDDKSGDLRNLISYGGSGGGCGCGG